MLVEHLSLLLAVLGVLCLLAVTSLMLIDTVLRSFFLSPITGLSEVTDLVAMIAVVCFMPISLQANHQLEIDFVARYFGRRFYLLSGLFGSTLLLIFFALVVWQLGRFSLHAHTVGETTYFLALKIAPWWLAATAILAICLPVQLLAMRRNWLSESGRIDVPSASEAAERDFEDTRL
jgi:TRAP-type C4-dicarboxylate transport system permease small subunit